MKIDLTKEKQAVYVGSDNSVTVICPHCRIRYKVNAGKVTTRGRSSKLRCKCKRSFSVFLNIESTLAEFLTAKVSTARSK
ncbi:MAG: hypothetical protein JRF69_11995, partial [Deltaproteobacteria bacterium]|nr:hypothetical protein [Deltaproteobacteria bacterium]